MKNSNHNDFLCRCWPLLIILLSFAQLSCSMLYTEDRPEVQYRQASDAEQLQIPPDLTAPDNSARLIISGVEGGKIERNTLLPNIDVVRLVREGDISWLEIDASAESLWPKVRQFILNEGYKLKADEPLSGYLETSWEESKAVVPARGISGFFSSALEVLRLSKDLHSFVFRFERAGAERTRLFVRHRQIGEDRISAGGREDTGEFAWTEAARDAELEALVINRLAAFLGVEIQYARGELDEQAYQQLQAKAYFIEGEEGAATLMIADTLAVTWLRMGETLENIGFDIDQTIEATHRYRVVYDGSFVPEAQTEQDQGFFARLASALDTEDDLRYYQVYLQDQSGGTAVSVRDDNGGRLRAEEESALLGAIRKAFFDSP